MCFTLCRPSWNWITVRTICVRYTEFFDFTCSDSTISVRFHACSTTLAGRHIHNKTGGRVLTLRLASNAKGSSSTPGQGTLVNDIQHSFMVRCNKYFSNWAMWLRLGVCGREWRVMYCRPSGLPSALSHSRTLFWFLPVKWYRGHCFVTTPRFINI